MFVFSLPHRLQVYMTSNLILMMLGGTLATMILTTFGYRWLYTVCIALQIIAFLLVIILVKENQKVTKTVRDSLVDLKNVFKWRENVMVLWLLLFAGPINMAIFICNYNLKITLEKLAIPSKPVKNRKLSDDEFQDIILICIPICCS